MTVVSRKLDMKRIDDVAQLLNQVVDAEANSRHAHELLEEISQLLWAVSSLDPDAEDLLKHSDYVADLVAHSPH
jgi:hypothetical protein